MIRPDLTVAVRGDAGQHQMAQAGSGNAVLDFLREGQREFRKVRLWDDDAGLYKAAEAEWRKIKTDYIPNPYHNCTPKCRLRHIRAVAYYNTTNTFDAVLMMMQKGTPDDPGTYHFCFPDHCEHLRREHYCTLDACPHKITYPRDGVKPLPFFWVCPLTATVHACGKFCDATKTRPPPDYHLVCTLTGSVLGGMICETDDYNLQRADLLLVQGREKCAPGMPALPPSLPRKRTRREQRIDTWDSEATLDELRTLIARLFTELAFSERRQISEVAAIFEARAEADEHIAAGLRRTRGGSGAQAGRGYYDECVGLKGSGAVNTRAPSAGGGVCVVPHVMNGYYPRLPTTQYFRMVPLRPPILAAVQEKLTREARGELGAIPDHFPHPFTGECHHCLILEADARRHTIVSGLVTQHRMLVPRPEQGHVAWGDASWKATMTGAIAIVARVAARIWQNLVRFSRVSGDVRFCHFERFALPIVYLMRSEFSIPVTGVAPCPPKPADTKRIRLDDDPPPEDDDADPRFDGVDGRRVVVIPYLPETRFLPPESALMDYSSAQPALQNRQTMTAATSAIKNALWDIAFKGHLFDLEIRIADIMGEAAAARE